ncbi:MAG: hypothetical protein JSR39_11020 [Verrucomicrobia bacterium]|nr:hypothetical protein [Verrucomicrobiota bacterium]
MYRHDNPQKKTKELPSNLPWFTGPLLAPSAHVVPAGHWNIEPYLFATTNYGHYGPNWHTTSIPKFFTANVEIPIQYGPVKPIDVEIVPQFSWNHVDGASQWVVNDLPLILDIQLLYDKPGKWWPAIKLTLKANAPIGKYQKLDPHKLGTDIGGAGTWNETIALVFSHLYHISGVHYYAPRLYIGYTVPNPVHVKNLNAYGGAKGTRGKVYPGNTFVTILGMELSLTPHWALACDFQYQHSNKTRFSGKATAPMGGPSSEQFSVAPAFEYNWNANIGIIAGAWFTFAGRNTTEFASGVVAFNIYK